MLKTIIILLMIALVASLASGLVFLMSDQGGNPNKKRLFTSLGVRLGSRRMPALAVIVYSAVITGQLGQQNPWDPGPASATGEESRAAQAAKAHRFRPLALRPRVLPTQKRAPAAPLWLPGRRSEDVDKQKQKHPYDVHEMPIPAGRLKAKVISRGEVARLTERSN